MFLSPGTIIDGKYEIRGTIGSGGMGIVYEAYQQAVDRLVALKVLTYAPSGDVSEVQRFEREAMALNRLKHPNIVQFYSYGIAHGYPYIVMERLHGVPLQRLQVNESRSRTELTWQHSIKIVLQICDALEHAHAQGVFHRDIKPSNIFLINRTPGDTEPIAKLIDFGLAKLTGVDGGQKLTQTGMALGSVMFMSPEQCTGGSVDGRTDIYAIGCLLYECFTGDPPFTGDNGTAVMFQHVNDSIGHAPKWSQLTPAQQHVIGKCMAKKPEQRYARASELRSDLEDILAGNEPQSNPAPAQISRATTKQRVPPRTVIALLTGIIAIGALGIFALNHWQLVSKARSDIKEEVQQTYERGMKQFRSAPETCIKTLVHADEMATAHPDAIDAATRYQIKLDLGNFIASYYPDSDQAYGYLVTAREISQQLSIEKQSAVLLALSKVSGARQQLTTALSQALLATEILERALVKSGPSNKAQLESQCAAAWEQVGWCHERLNDQKAGEAALRKSLVHAQTLNLNVRMHALLGVANNLAKQMRFAEAIQVMQTWLKLAAQADEHDNTTMFERAAGYQHLGNLHREISDCVTAQKDFEKALDSANKMERPGNNSILCYIYLYQALNFYACNKIEAGDQSAQMGERFLRPKEVEPGLLPRLQQSRVEAVKRVHAMKSAKP